MSAYKLGSIRRTEWETKARKTWLDMEAVNKLREDWCDYIYSLPKTPYELQLAKARANQALELVRSKQKAVLAKAVSPPKSDHRPLTALHNSPRTTSRMKQVIETRMQGSKIKEPKSEYNLCPRCGLVRDSIWNHQHAEQRLKKLLAQHPSLLPKRRSRKLTSQLPVL
ncbi:uncharacterized protein LOC108105739 [Drosophila eugracilis]|uniref:uncharacterized protein LOC108105739 n=1 Tax=Drosophila eugracilis TaxID=29029 RepID=UPI0007E785D1|nr:uncharacterized protein LOC108105739 [Drosophila eugracilis]